MHYAELQKAWAELTAPGAPFEIVEVEVRGQMLRCYKNAPPNIRAFWLSTAAFGDRPYLVYQDERITYAEAHAKVASIANWLVSKGVGHGDRVAIAMRNYPEWLLIYWACVSIGVAAVGMNAWWTAEEMDYALSDSKPKVLFADAERLARVAEKPQMAQGMTVVAVRADPPVGAVAWSEVVAQGGTMPDAQIDPDDDACIFYTSGTTGHPKGAQLTHRGCVANLFNMLFSGQAQGLATQRATGVAPPDPATAPPPAALLTTPLFHVTANNCGAYLVTAAGGKIVLMYRWDAGEALKLIEREKVSAMSGVPVMARELIGHPDFATTDTSSLVSLGGGGAQLQPDLVAKIDSSVATARPNTGYGMTETCGIITSVSGDFFVDKPDSAGPAMPTFEIKCVDDEGRTLPRGEVGELWVKGSPVIKGYINRPEATAQSITDGWLHTGDVARIDEDGFIFIVDRKKDMVLRGGENIYCAEVESCIFRHPAVAECCVFGVPDPRLGEEVGAAVVLKPGQSLTEEELRAHCASLIAKHKIPRFIWFMEESLPRNASGKFLKRELRERLAPAAA
ncbi:MAG: class I adenylate-forming enzyme family protein [Phenylobacterium sp.]|uniref:class I adenylate-forming enzyme family protein n=1 Tax=Phenylobacterium sp. TaxID=1871053 RepID=UPI003919515A